MTETWTISVCSKCRALIEVVGYDGELGCPNAEFPNKTKHGSYEEVEVEVAPASRVSALEELAEEVANCMPDVALRHRARALLKDGER